MENEEYKIDFERAESNFKKGDIDLATKEFKDILEKWPDDARSHSKLGACFASQNNFEEARFYIEKAIELDSKFSESYNNLGNIFIEKRDYKKAIPLFKKALELNPDYAAAHSNLGLAYKKVNKYNEAIREFKKAAEIDRKAPIAELKKVAKKPRNKINFLTILLIFIGLIVLWVLFKK
ncbi:MAG: tetratricopeptide repeat protein [Candidatus Caldatribacteriota bacterium]|nr:tetratricopeptide repeat protein [Candidatus Caldatribacteriota bacterium]